MGASYVGESIKIIENVDFAFIVGRTVVPILGPTGEPEAQDRFFITKLVSTRDKSPRILSFKHRFKIGNDMALMEDFNLPQSLSLSTTEELIKEKFTGQGVIKTKGTRSIR